MQTTGNKVITRVARRYLPYTPIYSPSKHPYPIHTHRDTISNLYHKNIRTYLQSINPDVSLPPKVAQDSYLLLDVGRTRPWLLASTFLVHQEQRQVVHGAPGLNSKSGFQFSRSCVGPPGVHT